MNVSIFKTHQRHYEKNLNIKYHEISDSQSLYPDTSWNTNQLCFTSVNGLLTDVCHIYKNGNFEKKIQLAVKNLSNEQAPTVYFHINYKNEFMASIIKNGIDENGSLRVLHEIGQTL